MSLPDPRAAPDPTLARVVLDVEAVATELEHTAPYFAARGHDSDAFAAAIVATSTPAAHTAYARMHANRHNLEPVDYLAAHTLASVMRGIAYGLEYARQTA